MNEEQKISLCKNVDAIQARCGRLQVNEVIQVNIFCENIVKKTTNHISYSLGRSQYIYLVDLQALCDKGYKLCLFSGRFNLLNVLKSVMTMCPLNCWEVKKCVTDVVAILMKGVQSVMWHEILNTVITIITTITIIDIIDIITIITIIIIIVIIIIIIIIVIIEEEERVAPLAEMTPLEVLPNINPPPLLQVIASSSL